MPEFEFRLFRRLADPVRYGDEREIFYFRYELDFLRMVFCRAVENPRCGVFPFLGAFGAGGFPFFASAKVKVGAMSRHRPAVVKGPHDRPAVFPEKFQKGRGMQIVSVQIVQMDNVRRILFMSSTNLSVEIFASGLSESNMRVHRTFGYLCHGEPDAHDIRPAPRYSYRARRYGCPIRSE